jgi:hypothetical protein
MSRRQRTTSVNSFNCVIVKCLVVHGLGDISCVCLACLVPQNLKQSATTHGLHWKKKIQCGCNLCWPLVLLSPGLRYKSRSMSKSWCWILYIITSLLVLLRCSKVCHSCVYDLLIAFSKFLTERHVHIRQQSESVGLSCPNLNLSILHIFKSLI